MHAYHTIQPSNRIFVLFVSEPSKYTMIEFVQFKRKLITMIVSNEPVAMKDVYIHVLKNFIIGTSKKQVCLEKGPYLTNQWRQAGKYPYRKVDPLHELAQAVTRKIEAYDFKGAIQLASWKETVANFNAATYSALLSKHPSIYLCTCIPLLPLTPVSIQVLPGVLLTAIQSFPNGLFVVQISISLST